MKLHSLNRLFFGTALAFSIPITLGATVIPEVSAQPLPRQFSPTPRDQGRVPSYRGNRDMERAQRDILKAEEESFKVSALAAQISLPAAVELSGVGDRLLSQARIAYEGGNYFQAAETALAAKDTYEATETLYEGALGYVLGGREPRPGAVSRGPSRSYYEAPYRVTEELSRAEAEVAYYQSNDSTVADLLQRARSLARPAEPVASSQLFNPNDFTVLTDNRAAIHLAKAATHLMRAGRGF